MRIYTIPLTMSFTADTFRGPVLSEEPEVQFDVDDIEEENDLIVLTNQISADGFVSNEDVLHTEELIKADRESSSFRFNIWDVMKKGAINLILPFINGMMLGFGEILAHEIGFKYNWIGAKVPPKRQERRERTAKFL